MSTFSVMQDSYGSPAQYLYIKTHLDWHYSSKQETICHVNAQCCQHACLQALHCTILANATCCSPPNHLFQSATNAPQANHQAYKCLVIFLSPKQSSLHRRSTCLSVAFELYLNCLSFHNNAICREHMTVSLLPTDSTYSANLFVYLHQAC